MSQARAICSECGQPTDTVKPATAARIIGRDYSRVRQLLTAGRFPNAVRPSGHVKHWLIPLDDIEAYLEARG